ncbi:MAG: von Willebrand factor type A domain-containing protein [Minicystis sp.]
MRPNSNHALAALLVTLFAAGCGSTRYPGSSVASRAPMQPAYAYPAATAAAVAPMGVATEAERPKSAEAYKDYGVNPLVDPQKDRFSTFSIDVDTASYAISRRKIIEGGLPPYQAVRVEEFLNYFDYGYEAPQQGPFAVHLAAAPSPFAAGKHVLRVGLQARRVAPKDRKPVHLVYLVDTSGSMESADKLGLAKKSLKLLTNTLGQGDTVALCTYAGSTREVLAPTGAERKGEIFAAIDDLTAGGSTAMESGIQIAYRLAGKTAVAGHVNRVVILSDGDANVGATSHDDLLKTIRSYKEKGITLSTVGFGQGNYQDTTMEQLADQGDGNYSYIDSETQAKRVFSEQVSGLLEVVARDVKIQVEFDPAVVKQYRLLGYENRDIADKDFRNDKVDAGEVGAGHSVTAVYEVILANTQSSPVTVRLRHKAPTGTEAAVESVFKMDPASISASFEAAPQSLRFAAGVAEFGEILRKSPHAAGVTFAEVEKIARAAAKDRQDQQEMLDLLHRADALAGGKPLAMAQAAQ